jgi:hypothetical protein
MFRPTDDAFRGVAAESVGLMAGGSICVPTGDARPPQSPIGKFSWPTRPGRRSAVPRRGILLRLRAQEHHRKEDRTAKLGG